MDKKDSQRGLDPSALQSTTSSPVPKPSLTDPTLRLTFTHLLILLGIISLIGSLLIREGYSFTSIPLRLTSALFVTVMLGILFSFTVVVDIGWLRTAGAFAAFTAVFFLTRPTGGLPQGDLDIQLPQLTSQLNDITPAERGAYKKYADAQNVFDAGFELIQKSRPVIFSFVNRASPLSRWKRNLISQITIDYNALDRKPTKEAAEELYSRALHLKDHMADEPLFAHYYPGIYKKAIEHGVAPTSEFVNVLKIVRQTETPPDLPVGDMYRTAANTARRLAEFTNDPKERRNYLDTAKGLLNTADTKNLRPIDQAFNAQSRAQIAEVAGDYTRAIAFINEAVQIFDRPDEPYALAKAKNTTHYHKLRCERIRLNATAGMQLQNLEDLVNGLRDAGEDFLRVGLLYVTAAYPTYYNMTRNNLLIAKFDRLNESLYGIVRSLEAARIGDFSTAKNLIKTSMAYCTEAGMHREVMVLSKWLEQLEQGIVPQGNYLAETKFLPDDLAGSN